MERFAKATLSGLPPPLRLERCEELAGVLVARLAGTTAFHEDVKSIVTELRMLGHDLWSFDESDGLEIWTPSYPEGSGPGIAVTFTPDDVRVDWVDDE